MSFRVLSESLRSPAEHVIKYFRRQRGLTKIKIEEEVRSDLPRPTIQGMTTDYELICIELAEDSCYPITLSRFVEDFRGAQLACKIYVATPSQAENSRFQQDLIRAKKHGIGVLAVHASGTVDVINEAVSLVHNGVRPIQMSQYPPKMRNDLTKAQHTYLSGNPQKGASEIYELIESITRKIAESSYDQGLWSVKLKKKNFKRGNWGPILELVYQNADFSKMKGLSKQLWAGVIALTTERNEVSHKIDSFAERQQRDLELRTRFEKAADLLRDIIQAAKGFKY